MRSCPFLGKQPSLVKSKVKPLPKIPAQRIREGVELERTPGINELGEGVLHHSMPIINGNIQDFNGRPWFVLGAMLWLQPWTPGFKASEVQVNHYPVWIQMPELPIEMFEKKTLETIGNAIGKTLKVHAHSLNGERRRFAALCILIQEGKRIPKRAWLGKVMQEIDCVNIP